MGKRVAKILVLEEKTGKFTVKIVYRKIVE